MVTVKNDQLKAVFTHVKTTKSHDIQTQKIYPLMPGRDGKEFNVPALSRLALSGDSHEYVLALLSDCFKCLSLSSANLHTQKKNIVCLLIFM